MQFLNNQYINLLARLILGGLFIFAGLGKIAIPEAFAKEIANYELLPYSLVNFVAITLPWLEVVAGIFLVAGVRIKASAVIIAALLLVFLVGILWAMSQGLKIDCGCFAQVEATPVGWPKVLQNLGLLALAIYLIKFPLKTFSLESLAFKDSAKTVDLYE
ncbi:MAG: MauE/DoxX family redox-associated membrane protein [Bacteroidota bacterium]